VLSITKSPVGDVQRQTVRMITGQPVCVKPIVVYQSHVLMDSVIETPDDSLPKYRYA